MPIFRRLRPSPSLHTRQGCQEGSFADLPHLLEGSLYLSMGLDGLAESEVLLLGERDRYRLGFDLSCPRIGRLCVRRFRTRSDLHDRSVQNPRQPFKAHLKPLITLLRFGNILLIIPEV